MASDTFIMAMILKMCAQMEILAYRMQIFPELCKTKYIKYPEMEQKILCDWIKQHESLYKLRDELNAIFNLVFFLQFVFTTLAACVMTIQLTAFNIITIKFWSAFTILMAILMEIGVLCVSGHFIIEKSRNIGSAVFNIDWISLTKSTRMSLIQIILRSNDPIKFTAGRLVPLSIDTFSAILRLTYSIYNCMSKH